MATSIVLDSLLIENEPSYTIILYILGLNVSAEVSTNFIWVLYILVDHKQHSPSSPSLARWG